MEGRMQLTIIQPEPEPVASAPKPCCGQADVGEFGWTCQMHPQVVRSTPGTCDLCGMPLEPIGHDPGTATDRAG